VAAGAAAEVVTPASVIAVGGGIGAVVAVFLTLSWRRVASPDRRPRSWASRNLPAAELLVPASAEEYLVSARAPAGP
jgi:hypothetical protein